MGAKESKSVAGNSIPLVNKSWYTRPTPDNSAWPWKALAQDCIKLKTFSCTAVGGSFLGPMSFTYNNYYNKDYTSVTSKSSLPILVQNLYDKLEHGISFHNSLHKFLRLSSCTWRWCSFCQRFALVFYV